MTCLKEFLIHGSGSIQLGSRLQYVIASLSRSLVMELREFCRANSLAVSTERSLTFRIECLVESVSFALQITVNLDQLSILFYLLVGVVKRSMNEDMSAGQWTVWRL